MENLPLGRLTLEAEETVSVFLLPVWDAPEILKLELKVANIIVSPETSLETENLLPLD